MSTPYRRPDSPAAPPPPRPRRWFDDVDSALDTWWWFQDHPEQHVYMLLEKEYDALDPVRRWLLNFLSLPRPASASQQRTHPCGPAMAARIAHTRRAGVKFGPLVKPP